LRQRWQEFALLILSGSGRLFFMIQIRSWLIFLHSKTLERVNGIQMGVPDFDTQFKISKWEVKDIQPKFDLPQLWVHVEGVPHTLRHFHGLWALGSLMGTTVYVDLPTLYNQNVVRILVAMMNLDTLNKHQDDKGYYVDVTVTLKLKGCDFWFRKQKAYFKPDTMYSPFFWRRKDDDLDDHDMTKSKGKGLQILSHGASSSQATGMDVDGSGAIPAAAGSRTRVQHHSFSAGPVQVLSRPAAAPARGRPNILGRIRLGTLLGCTRVGRLWCLLLISARVGWPGFCWWDRAWSLGRSR
jgi:hypothetical protein